MQLKNKVQKLLQTPWYKKLICFVVDFWNCFFLLLVCFMTESKNVPLLMLKTPPLLESGTEEETEKLLLTAPFSLICTSQLWPKWLLTLMASFPASTSCSHHIPSRNSMSSSKDPPHSPPRGPSPRQNSSHPLSLEDIFASLVILAEIALQQRR